MLKKAVLKCNMKRIHFFYILSVIILTSGIVLTRNHHSKPIARMKSPESVVVCKNSLKQTLDGIKAREDQISSLAKNCYNNYNSEECKELSVRAKSLESFLDGGEGNDLGLRWNFFSCSPILFSKLRAIRKSSDNLLFLTTLRGPSKDILKESQTIIEPELYFEKYLIDSEERCCK
jgi:hypothetical protein